MVTTHNLGFPRIGKNRELKFALESYWRGDSSQQDLHHVARTLRQSHWQAQNQCDYIPVGDFSFYDHVLDTSFLVGNIPDRASNDGSDLDTYFQVARGQSHSDDACHHIAAGEMTKWFDTNYHYIVPEFNADTSFSLRASRLISQINEAKQQGLTVKPVIPLIKNE